MGGGGIFKPARRAENAPKEPPAMCRAGERVLNARTCAGLPAHQHAWLHWHTCACTLPCAHSRTWSHFLPLCDAPRTPAKCCCSVTPSASVSPQSPVSLSVPPLARFLFPPPSARELVRSGPWRAVPYLSFSQTPPPGCTNVAERGPRRDIASQCSRLFTFLFSSSGINETTTKQNKSSFSVK